MGIMAVRDLTVTKGLINIQTFTVDTLTRLERSERMSRVRSTNTKPEMKVRKLLFSMGYRYRLHGQLPGRPDIVFTRKKKVIFVHGCFWHRHVGCPNCRMPKSRVEFWTRKLEGNRRRDEENQEKLRQLGWTYLIIWECELTNSCRLEMSLRRFLG